MTELAASIGTLPSSGRPALRNEYGREVVDGCKVSLFSRLRRAR